MHTLTPDSRLCCAYSACTHSRLTRVSVALTQHAKSWDVDHPADGNWIDVEHPDGSRYFHNKVCERWSSAPHQLLHHLIHLKVVQLCSKRFSNGTMIHHHRLALGSPAPSPPQLMKKSLWNLTDDQRAHYLPPLDPYDNPLFMSLVDFIQHPLSKELLHNGQGFQVGLWGSEN